MRIACLLAGLWGARLARAHDWLGAVTDTSRLAEPLVYAVPCAPFPAAAVPGCHPTECKRAAIDDFIAPEEVAILLGMVEKGLGEPLTAGPAIMDVNTGFVRDGRGLRNLYRSRPGKKEPRVHFTQTEYETYASVFHRIRDQIRAIFHLDTLYFTAPTFITRTGGNPEWRPADMHGTSRSKKWRADAGRGLARADRGRLRVSASHPWFVQTSTGTRTWTGTTPHTTTTRDSST